MYIYIYIYTCIHIVVYCRMLNSSCIAHILQLPGRQHEEARRHREASRRALHEAGT